MNAICQPNSFCQAQSYESTIPSTLSYDTPISYVDMAKDAQSSLSKAASKFLRGGAMPLFKSKEREKPEFQANNEYGNSLLEYPHPHLANHKEVREQFQTSKLNISINTGNSETYQFNLRVVEPKKKHQNLHTLLIIGGSQETIDNAMTMRIRPLLASAVRAKNAHDIGLRILFMSHYQNSFVQGKSITEWTPTSSNEVGAAALDVIKALSENNVKIDTLMTHSLGNLVFDGLQYLKDDELDIVPDNIIMNRAFTSMQKTLAKLNPGYFWNGTSIMGCLFQLAAYCFDWNANPEESMINYAQRLNEVDLDKLKKKRLIVIEAMHDNYFGDVGAFSEKFDETLNSLGLNTHRAKFCVPQIHSRIHHSVHDHFLVNSHGLNLNNFVPMKPYEAVTDILMKEIFLKP